MPAPLALDRMRRRLLDFAGRLSWFPPLLARITLGVVFVQSGWGKLQDLGKITHYFTELHIPAPAFNAALVATTEFVGGALLLVGLLARLASLPLLFSMTIAILTAKRDQIDGVASVLGFEEFTYIVLFAWIAIAGPGPVSLDRLLDRWFRPPPGES